MLVLLCRAFSTVSTVHKGYEPQSKLPLALSLPQQRNSTKLPSFMKYDPYPPCMHDMSHVFML